MVHHGRQIILKKFRDTCSIFLFGDLQFGTDGFDEEAWEQFEDEFKSTPHAYALGLGDYEDWLRPTMRARVLSQMAHDDSARQQLDDKIRRDQDRFLDRLQFLEGKIIGLHSGHHEWEFSQGDNSTQRLASALKAPYLGWMASTRLILGFIGCRTHEAYTIISMHGSGSSAFATTDARSLETKVVPAWVANHYVRGHSCKSVAWSPCERHIIRRAGPYGETIQTIRCMNIGGFSRGYTDGWKSSYVERSGMLPQPVGWGIIRLKFTDNKITRGQRGVNQRGSKILDVESIIRNPR